jgi:hypothetical protein
MVESLTKIITTTTRIPADEVLERKIAVATEGLSTTFCEGLFNGHRNRVNKMP